MEANLSARDTRDLHDRRAWFLKNRERRRTAIAVVAGLAISFAIVFVGGYVCDRLRHWLVPGPYGTKELPDNPILNYIVLIGVILWSIATATVSSRIRQWLTRDNTPTSAQPIDEFYEEPQQTV